METFLCQNSCPSGRRAETRSLADVQAGPALRIQRQPRATPEATHRRMRVCRSSPWRCCPGCTWAGLGQRSSDGVPDSGRGNAADDGWALDAGVLWLSRRPPGDASRPSRTRRFASGTRPDVGPMAEVAQTHKRPQGARALRTALPRWPRRHCDRIPRGDGADRDASLQNFDGLRLTLMLMRHADTDVRSSAPLTPSARPLRMHGTTSRATLVTLSRLLLSLAPSGGRARLSAVALPAIALPTQRHLREASSAQEEAGGGLNVHGIELRALRSAASTASGTDRGRVLTTRHRHRLRPRPTNLEPCAGWCS